MFIDYRGKAVDEADCLESIIEGSSKSGKPKVLIKCATYNQEHYIKDALEGFVTQKTNFPFLAIVHDDASTDSTADVIKQYADKYPGIIVPMYDKVNRWSQEQLDYVMETAIDAYQPDYIAICEGDDYWTDPLKLQKQVEYMESHPECVMCHCNYELADGSRKRTQEPCDDEPYFGPMHKHKYYIATFTVLIRYAAYKKLPHYGRQHSWPMGDYPLWIELSQEGKFYYFQDVVGRYRILPNSASHSTNCEKIKEFWQGGNDITKFYSELYGYPYVGKPIDSLYLEIQKQCCRNNDKEHARKYWIEAKKEKATGIRSFVFYFCNIHNLKCVIKAIYRFLD